MKKNDRKIHLIMMNKKQNDYQNVTFPFFYLWLETAHFFILYDLGAETISDIYFSSPDL